MYSKILIVKILLMSENFIENRKTRCIFAKQIER